MTPRPCKPQAEEKKAAGAQTARQVAWDVLGSSEREGGWAEEILPRRLAAAGLGPTESRFCRELVFGVIKSRLFLDFVILPLLKSKRPPQPGIMNLLRLGAYQLLLLSKVPAHAAVDEMVALAKAVYSPEVAGFVNAVLREAIRKGPQPLPDQARDPEGHLSIRYSFPPWIIRRWVSRFGTGTAAAMMAAANEAPPLVLRVNALRTTRDQVIRNLEQHNIAAEALEAPMALRVSGGGDPAGLPGFAAGEFYFQDQGSQWIGYVVDPRPGQTCLDVCSAPGGKATHLAELTGNVGTIWAHDRNMRKLRRVGENAARLGLSGVILLPDLARVDAADRVLVDVPCSNLGTLRRHAEARYRLREQDLARLASAQLNLVSQAAKYVKIGGTLVYATCTTEPEENEAVVEEFLKTHAGFRLEPGPGISGLPPAKFWSGGFFRTFPASAEDDGLFAARMVRRA